MSRHEYASAGFIQSGSLTEQIGELTRIVLEQLTGRFLTTDFIIDGYQVTTTSGTPRTDNPPQVVVSMIAHVAPGQNATPGGNQHD